MPEGSPADTHTYTSIHTRTHYLRADRGCPTKAGLPLVITIRSCPHSPDDPHNTYTHKYSHQANQMNTTLKCIVKLHLSGCGKEI